MLEPSVFKVTTVNINYPNMLTFAVDEDEARRIASATYNSELISSTDPNLMRQDLRTIDSFYRDANNAECQKLHAGVDYTFMLINDTQIILKLDGAEYPLTKGKATKMEITFSDWLIDELNNSQHLEFEDKALKARHQHFEAKDKNHYDFLVRTKDLNCRIYMSELAVEDAINFRKEKPCIYDLAKLKKLSRVIKDQLTNHGDFKLVTYADEFKLEEIF